jgi:hypothetical protein
MRDLNKQIDPNKVDNKDYIKNYLLNINRFGFVTHKIGDAPLEGTFFMVCPLNDDILLDLSNTSFSSGIVIDEPHLSLFLGHRFYGDFTKIGQITSDEPNAVLLCYKYTI